MSDRSGERVAAALVVLRRGSGAGSAGTVAYVVYVIAIFALVYGFPYGRTILAALGADRVVELAADPLTIVLLGVAYVGLLLLAHRGGRVTGPVSPPPIWTAHVLTAPVDRAVSLRRWWRLTLGGVLGAGAVLGIVVGLSLWSAGVTGPVGVLGSTLVLVAAAAILAVVWLRAQVAPEPALAGDARRGTSAMLRRLGVEGLLAQAGRRELLAAGVLSGSAETIREQTVGGAPAPRGVLRPGRLIVLRRDLLALRRAGTGLLSPFVVVGLGAWLTAQAVVLDLPALAAVGAGTVYLGATAWGRPLRLQAGRAGTPALLGWGGGEQAVRHLALPGALLAGSVVVGSGLVALTTGAAAALAVMTITPLVLGMVAWSAFRPMPRLTTVMPQSTIPSLVMWWLTPVLLVAAVTGIALWRSPDLAGAAVAIVGTGALVLGWSIVRAARAG